MSQAKEVKQDRKYTKDHEWALSEGSELLVGITAFAVDQLGDVTLISLDVKVGDRVEAHKAFGTIESVKTLSDLFAPVSGVVTRINGDLEKQPELVNEDPLVRVWMVAIKPSTPADADARMDVGADQAHVKESAHCSRGGAAPAPPEPVVAHALPPAHARRSRRDAPRHRQADARRAVRNDPRERPPRGCSEGPARA